MLCLFPNLNIWLHASEQELIQLKRLCRIGDDYPTTGYQRLTPSHTFIAQRPLVSRSQPEKASALSFRPVYVDALQEAESGRSRYPWHQATTIILGCLPPAPVVVFRVASRLPGSARNQGQGRSGRVDVGRVKSLASGCTRIWALDRAFLCSRGAVMADHILEVPSATRLRCVRKSAKTTDDAPAAGAKPVAWWRTRE